MDEMAMTQIAQRMRMLLFIMRRLISREMVCVCGSIVKLMLLTLPNMGRLKLLK